MFLINLKDMVVSHNSHNVSDWGGSIFYIYGLSLMATGGGIGIPRPDHVMLALDKATLP